MDGLKRIALGIQYDGADWRGWQTQPDGHTVQDRLQAAIQDFTQQCITVMCAGRTDAGVHAIEQVVHLDTELERLPVSWVRGVNSYLPPSIAVRWAHEVPREFHARSSARARCYRYLLYNHPVRSPLWRGRAGWVFRSLALEPMRQAVQYLIGEHDFSAFRAAECQSITPVKTMQEIRIEQRGNLFLFEFRADAFLHHMIRNLMGSLISVGKGDQPPEWLNALLAGRDRRRAAPTFMPDGLYLARVIYEDKWGLPQQPLEFPW
jgi:tRNA pseudouridine38-40 synthase